MQKKFFITTAIAYVNAPPHLGFALESIQADVLARAHRARKEEVFFETGTDEHGTKIQRAAEKEGIPTAEFVLKNAKLFQDLKPALNLSWDAFSRTNRKEPHWGEVEKIWKKLEKNGDLYKKTYEGLYCVGCEAFITKKDLVDGKCHIHLREPEKVSEENWFFRLSKYGKELEKLLSENTLRVVPEYRKNEVLSLIGEGLEDISFSRPRKDLPWGIPVPGDDSQTIYVWADALVNYMDYPEHWPADVHLIGKDILRFHAIIWPAMLISAGLPLPKSIFTHGFITTDGQKMSKSLGNVVDPFELVRKYGIDPVRYYLLREIPSGEDGDFTHEKMKDRYNGDLANGLGNFYARVLTLASKYGEIHASPLEKEIEEKIEEVKKASEEKLDNFRLHDALGTIWELVGLGDRYVNGNKVWEIKDEEEKKRKLHNLLVILENLGVLLVPFLPETAEKIAASISREGEVVKVTKGANLFPRLS